MALTPNALVNKSLELVSPPSTYTQLDESVLAGIMHQVAEQLDGLIASLT
jgi:hypothetical protein